MRENVFTVSVSFRMSQIAYVSCEMHETLKVWYIDCLSFLMYHVVYKTRSTNMKNIELCIVGLVLCDLFVEPFLC